MGIGFAFVLWRIKRGESSAIVLLICFHSSISILTSFRSSAFFSLTLYFTLFILGSNYACSKISWSGASYAMRSHSMGTPRSLNFFRSDQNMFLHNAICRWRYLLFFFLCFIFPRRCVEWWSRQCFHFIHIAAKCENVFFNQIKTNQMVRRNNYVGISVCLHALWR